MNRADRHPAAALFLCPDCASTARLTSAEPGLLRVTVAHDPTCPWLAAGHDLRQVVALQPLFLEGETK